MAFGQRPSTMLGIEDETDAFLYDLRIYAALVEKQEEAETVKGEIERKQRGWPEEVNRELRELQRPKS